LNFLKRILSIKLYDLEFQVSYIRNAGFINNQQGSQQTPNFIYQQALNPQHVLHGGNHNIPHGNVNFPRKYFKFNFS